MKRIAFLILLSGTALIWFSCSEEDPVAGFATLNGEGNEGIGTDTIVIEFGKKLTESMTISIMVGGSAALDGDYSLSFPSILPDYNNSTAITSVTVKAGQSSLPVVINIVDDAFVEPVDEEIYILISGVSDDKVASWLKNDLYTYVVHDNDDTPADGLQVDLSWYLGDGISVNEANFDLYLVHNVTLDDDGDVDTYEAIDTVYSAHTTGFESLKIGDEFPDEDYYLLIRYTSGSYDAILTLILSYDGLYSGARGGVSKDYAGQDIFYGPIVKNGTSYDRHITPAWRE